MRDLRMPATTPRVSRSAMVDGTFVVCIEGSQFEDGFRRLVVGIETTDETIAALTAALQEIGAEEDRRRWLTDMLAACSVTPASDQKEGHL